MWWRWVRWERVRNEVARRAWPGSMLVREGKRRSEEANGNKTLDLGFRYHR